MEKQNSEPETTRDSIINAVRETAKTDEGTAKYLERLEPIEKAKEAAERRFEPKEQDRSETVRDSIEGAAKPDSEPVDQSKLASQTYEVSDEDKERPSYKALPDSYETIDPAIRDYLDKIVNENEDYKARQTGKQYLTEVDKVLEPYKPKLKELGTSPAHLVGTLFGYATALSDPDRRYIAFSEICAAYGIDPSQLNDPAIHQDKRAFDHYAYQQQQQEAIQGQFRNAADSFVEDFSKGKPHFEAVRSTMAGLIATNQAKFIKNGKVDLDSAYAAACKALGLEVAQVTTERKPNKPQHRHKPNRNNTNDRSVRGAIRAALNESGQNA